METFVDYCKDYIKSHLNEMEGQMIYPCDLAYKLTEEPNVNGTLTYSSSEAKEYLREWWDEAGEYWEYEKANFGENNHNPFEEPEAYMVCMVIEGCEAILSSCNYISERWNDHIELTEENIALILEQVNEQASIDF